MSITLNIDASDPNELRDAVTGLAAWMTGDIKPEKKQNKKPAKPVEKTVEEKPEEQPDTEAEELPDVEPEEENTPGDAEKEISDVDLRAAVAKSPESRKAGKKLIQELGYSKLSDIPQDKRADFLSQLEELEELEEL